MIEVEGLTKRYGEKTAVDGLTFGIESGTVTGFWISSLVPRGLAFDSISDSTDSIILTVRSEMARCAGCFRAEFTVATFGRVPICPAPAERCASD